MNKHIIAYAFSLIGLLAFAQEELTPQQQVNSIKRNRTEYIFGESTGSTEEEAYELANEKFMTNLQNYIEGEAELKDAFAVMMPTINKSVKKISFDRRVNVKVVCLYINKADIRPLNSKPVAKKEKQEEKIEPNQTNQTNQVNQMNQADLSEKSVGILSVLGGMSDYANQKQWLEDRKQKEHDVMFGLAKKFNETESYWIVYNNDRQMIALIDKTRTKDLLTGMPIDVDKYASYPKLWIIIYE